VVVEVVEPSLGAHSVDEEENIIKEGLGALHDGNVLSKEPREEVPISEVEWVNVGLAQPQDDDSELEMWYVMIPYFLMWYVFFS